MAVRRVRSAVSQYLSDKGGSKAACLATLLLAWALLAASLQGRGLVLRALCTLGMLLWSAAFLHVMGREGLLQAPGQGRPSGPHTSSPFEQSAPCGLPLPLMPLAVSALLALLALGLRLEMSPTTCRCTAGRASHR